MKIITLLVLLGVATAFAADEKFADHKKHMLAEMDQQIAALQTAKSCISGAADQEAVKHCHEELDKTRKRHRSAEIDERMHQLQEEKDKLNKE